MKNYTCDVLVAGGGVAGTAAAIAAARMGSKVILVEKTCVIGGLATAGLVGIYLPICDGMGNQVMYGLAEELLKLSVNLFDRDKIPEQWLNGQSINERKQQRYQVRFNPNVFAIELERLLLSVGVKILFDSVLIEANTDNGKLSSVDIFNCSQRCRIEFNTAIDATGDAVLCELAGENTVQYSKGNTLAAWYYSILQGQYNLNILGFSESASANSKPLVSKRFSGFDCDEMSEMLSLAHFQILQDVINKRGKHNDYTLVTIPYLPQLRMTRRIDGAYTIDDNDVFKHFDNSIGLGVNWKEAGPIYELPFTILHGNKIKNLLACGRCISATENMWDITRVIPVCAATGQAAGVAASLYTDMTVSDIKILQKNLINQGVKLHIDSNK